MNKLQEREHVMKFKRIDLFSKDEIEEIHGASMQLLSEVGMKVDSEETRVLLAKNGAIVDEKSNFVRFPESLIKEKLKTVPNSFTLYGPNESFHFEVNTTSTQFGTIGTPVKIYDPQSKKGVRKTVMEDTIKQIRIVDSLKHVMASHVDVWPNDINYLALHVHCIYQWAKNTKKAYGLGCIGKLASQDMMNMVSIVAGGEEEIIKKPRLIGFMNPTSPLHLPQIMTNGFSIFTKYKQPTIIAPEALAGTSSPITIAGLLAQTNAEIVASVVLSQIYNPGAPVFFGTVSHVTDMKTGNSAIGSVETGLISGGIAQLARFYGIPSRGPGAVTDSKLLDLQNGMERMQTLMWAALTGINYVTCAGTFEATLSEALELLVIDDELIGMIKRALEGVEVNEDTLAVDLIKKIALSEKKGSNFLGEMHTMKYMKKELYMASLLDRNRRNTWYKKGSKDLIQVAREKVEQILQTHEPPELDPTIEAKLKEYIKEVEARTFEYYKKVEGITSGSVSISGVTEIKSDDA
ncbi:MAG: trimethylamine methyltransferase family protein [Promethearchaeota archaeon]